MKKLISIYFIILTSLHSYVVQTSLIDGRWQLVGFAGNHLANSSVSYQEDNAREVIDIADANTTYLVKENSSDNGQLAYIRNDYTLSTTYINSTTKLRASIGLFAIKNVLSPSGKTTLASNLSSAVKIKVKKAKIYNQNIPHYRMYVKGRFHPILRIDYQANYEGSMFRVKFGNENEDYVAYFDHRKTYSDASTLQSSAGSSLDKSIYSANIRDVVDFSANDNNYTKMNRGEFKVKNTNGIYNEDLTDYASSNDFNLTVYGLSDENTWEIFNSLNKPNSNNFDTLDISKGYWIKADNARSRGILRTAETALISGDSFNANLDYSTLKNGWNLLNFTETYIRYSPSGVFIPQDIIRGDYNISIHRINRNGSTDRHLIHIPRTLFATSLETNSSSQSARYVNLYSKAQEEFFGYRTKIRAVPSIKVEANGSQMSGIIVISDSKFELNTQGSTSFPITTISGQALQPTSATNGFESAYGEYLSFINLSDLTSTDINASISLKMQKYKSSPLKIGDLNDINKTKQAQNILIGLNTLSIKAGETTQSNRNAIYLTTLNFNTTDDYNMSNSHNDILLSSGTRFSIADATYTKIYKFNRNGKFKLISSDGSIDIDSGETDNIANLITAINNATSTTNIVATSLGDNSDGDSQFMLTSTKKGIQILENDSINLFENISLISSNIANSSLAKGAIGSVHTFRDILNVDIAFNREAIDGIGDYLGLDRPSKASFTSIKTDDISDILTNVEFLSYLGDVIITDPVPPFVVPYGKTLIVHGDFNISQAMQVNGTFIVAGDVNSSETFLTTNDGFTIIKGNLNTNGLEVSVGGSLYVTGSINSITTPIITTYRKFVVGNVSQSDVQNKGLDYLDTNISGVPVGLFDLKGQPFPNTTPDLKSNPSPTLDFPISGGIIESMYENEKEIKTIMTMEYSSSNQGFWKITDLTKNIDTLYGNSYDSEEEFNNDYQGIFHLHPNKAYWVNIGSIDTTIRRPQDIKDAMELDDSKLTLQSYTHFSNTFNKGISTTQNHIDHRLNIKFKENNNFISGSGEGADYYNVVAIIKGSRYYLKRNGYYFSLDVNDNDMPLSEKVINTSLVQEKDEAIVLEAYDGTGLAFKETDNTAHFSIPYFKPLTPSFTWSNDNDLIIDANSQKDIDNNISILELHTRSVSDIESKRDKSILKENNVSISKDASLQWNYDDNKSLHGSLIALRAIIKKQNETKEVSFYSNIRAFLYAPTKQGHKLESNSTDATTKSDTKPYSYIQNTELNKDNGVQLVYINDNKDITKISMAYYPEGKEGVKSLQGTGFGGSKTMFLRVNTGATNKEAIASISYIPEYIGKIFYIYFDNKLYQGRFADNDNFSNDNDAYNLESDVISIDTFTNGSGTQADGDGGRVVQGSGQGV